MRVVAGLLELIQKPIAAVAPAAIIRWLWTDAKLLNKQLVSM